MRRLIASLIAAALVVAGIGLEPAPVVAQSPLQRQILLGPQPRTIFDNKVASTTSSSLVLDFRDVGSATGYQYSLSSTSASSGFGAWTTLSSKTVTSLSSSTQYWVKVRAVRGSLTGADSNTVTGTTASGASWTTVFDQSSTLNNSTDGGGDSNVGFRYYIPANLMGAASGNSFRITFRTGNDNSGDSSGLDHAYFGQADPGGGSPTLDFLNNPGAGSPAPAAWNGTNADVVVTGTLPEAYDESKTYIVSGHFRNGTGLSIADGGANTTGVKLQFYVGTSDASQKVHTQSTTSADNQSWGIAKIEISP